MSLQRYEDGVLRESWDDAARTYTAYDENGDPVPSAPENPNPRDYTPEENARADAEAAEATEASNKRTVEEAVADDLAAMQAIIDQTNADLRTDPSQEIKDIARAIRRLDRMALGDFSGTE